MVTWTLECPEVLPHLLCSWLTWIPLVWLPKPPSTTALGHSRRKRCVKMKPRALHRLPSGWPRLSPAPDMPRLSAFCCSTHNRFAMNFLQCFSPAAPGSGRIAATHSKLVLENLLGSEKQPQDVPAPDCAMHEGRKLLWALVCCSLGSALQKGLLQPGGEQIPWGWWADPVHSKGCFCHSRYRRWFMKQLHCLEQLEPTLLE